MVEGTDRFATLPRKKVLTKKPPSNEERVLAALERWFPGSHWIDEPPSASTSSSSSSADPGDTVPSGGTGALDYVVVVGNEYDPVEVRRWAEALPEGTRVMAGSPRFSAKNRVPMNGEAVLFEAYPSTQELPWGEDYLGKKFRSLQPGLLASYGFTCGAQLKLFGTGKRVDDARAVWELCGGEVGQDTSVVEPVVDRTKKPLEMVVIGTGPGPKNVLASDGVVYPYRKFKAIARS